MARYVIKDRKIWDGARKEWVIVGTEDQNVLREMCVELNKPRKRTKRETFYKRD
jgi:hypothetical protein